MHHFTIRDIENLSGIKAHTLRAWEVRYGLRTSKRRDSLHRYYDSEDLKHILRIAYLYHNGYKISMIARLSPNELIREAAKRFGNEELDVLLNRLIEAAVDYNQEEFERTIRAGLRSMGLEKTIEKLIYPFMDKIGMLWITGHVIPAQEHFSSHLIERTLLAAINAQAAVSGSHNRYLLFTPVGEAHEIPLLVIQYLIRKSGCATVMMGKETAMDMLAAFCEKQRVTHLYLHLISPLKTCQPEGYLKKLSGAFPAHKIIASGPALRDLEAVPANVEVIRSLDALLNYDFSRQSG